MFVKDAIIRLGEILKDEENAASDLWTWLPSYKAAKAVHGDYANNHRPSTASVLMEAAIFISFLRGFSKDREKEMGLFECPCGECERPQTCDNCSLYSDGLMRCMAIEGAPSCDEGKPHNNCPFIRGNKGFVQ